MVKQQGAMVRCARVNDSIMHAETLAAKETLFTLMLIKWHAAQNWQLILQHTA